MHVGLQTFDIVDNIFALIQQDCNVGTRTLKALSLTCISLREIALDRLWHTQPNFVALIKTMPPEHWAETPPRNTSWFGNYDFRVMDLHEKLLYRLNFYARRIRRVSYVPYAKHRSNYGGVPYDIAALHSLWSLRPDPSEPILPNLQHVEFPDARNIMLDMFLASPSIDVDIGIGGSDLAAAYSLQNFASNISSLYLGSPELPIPIGPSLEVLLEAIRQMSNLRVLRTSFKLDPAVLTHLATLPSLNKLGIRNCSQDILSAIAPLLTASFIALQDLELVETSLTTFARLLQKIGSLPLRNLTIHINYTRPATVAENELDRAFAALQKARATEGLRSLRIKASASEREPSSPATINFATLRPLLSCRHLHTLELDVDCKYHLTDSDFKDMASAWPNMRSLQIGPLKGWSTHSPDLSTSFHSLLYLLEGCQNLQRLVFAVNGLIPPPVAAEIAPHHINKQMTTLWLGNSSIDKFCVAAIRKFLKTVLPNVVSINGHWTVTKAGGRIDQQHRLWLEVAKSADELKIIYTNAAGRVNQFV